MDISDVRSMIKQAHLPETTVPLCLRGDLQAEFEKLERQLQEIPQRPRESLADDGGHGVAKGIAEKMEALRDQMRECTMDVTLRALARKDWKSLLEKHPPRDDVDSDRTLGLNGETFYDALILACWVEPDLEKDERTELLDLLTGAQFDKLAASAFALNRRDVGVPFSRTASRTLRNSDETPKQPPDSASA